MPGGRLKYIPSQADREAVSILAGGGVSQERIAKVLKISVPTLEKAFRDELDAGQTMVTRQAIATLILAMKDGGRGAVAAAAFWLKCRERWTETSAHRFVDDSGQDRKLDIDSVRAYMQQAPEDGEKR